MAAGPMQETSKQVQTQDMPQWLKDQYKTVSQAATNLAIDPATGQPRQMEKYPGQLQADTNPLLAQAQQGAAGLKPPDNATTNEWLINEAARSQSMIQDPNSINISQGYTPESYKTGEFANPDIKFQNTLAGYSPDVQAHMASAAQINAKEFAAREHNFTPERIAADKIAAERIAGLQRGDLRDVQAPTGLEAYLMNQPGQVVSPELKEYLMQMPENVNAEKLAPAQQWTDEGLREKYMNPYAEAVTDITQRKAKESFYEQLAREGSRAAGAGAFGGSRQGIVEGAMARDYATQASDIQAQGLQAAYENAQQQFERDRGAGLDVGKFNITTGLQAALANQQAGLTGGQANLQSQLATQQLRSQGGLLAQIANQQAALETAKANQAAQLGVQQLGTNAAMQAQLANQGVDVSFAGLGTDVAKANQQAMLEAQRANQQSGLAAAQSNQQTGLQAQIEGAQLGSQERQFGAGLSQEAAIAQARLQQETSLANQSAQMQAQQLRENLAFDSLKTQYGGNLQTGLAGAQNALEAARMGEQSRQFGFGQGQQAGQFGADLGMRGQIATQDARANQGRFNLAASGQAADQFQRVAQNDSDAFRNNLAATGLQGDLGWKQQQANQATADKELMLWQLQQQYPMMNMSQLSNILNQTSDPFTSQTTTGSTRAPNPWMQLGGMAIAGAGAASGLGLKF